MLRLPSATDVRLWWQTLTAPRASHRYQARQEYMTRVILVFIVLCLSVFTLPIIGGWLLGLFDIVSVFIMLLLILPAMLSFWWAHRGHWRWSSYYPPLAFFLLAMYLNYLAGLRTTAILFYMLSILLTGMLHSGKRHWYMIGICIVVYLALGWLHGDREIDFLTSAGITVTAGFVGVALLQWFFTNQLNNALAQAHMNAAELQSYRDRLEVLVQDRTAALQATNQELEREIDERQRAEVALQEAHDQLERRVQERTSELSTLLRAAKAVASDLDTEQVLTVIAELMSGAVKASRCAVFRFDRSSSALTPWTRWPPAETTRTGFASGGDKSAALTSVLLSGRPLVVQVSDPNVDPAEVDWFQAIDGTSNKVLALPLANRDHLAGLIELEKDAGGQPFSAGDVRLCRALADQAAVALERRRAETALRESEARYRNLFETSPESITVIDLEGMILDCNLATERLSSLSRKELIGHSFAELGVLEDKDIQKTLELFSSIPEDRISALEFQILGPDNERRWLDIFPSLLEKDGQVYAVQVIARDMTARIQAAQHLKERQRYLEQVLAAAPDAIVTSDPQQHVVEWNPGAEKLFGYTPQEAIGQDLDDLIANPAVWKEATGFTRRVQAGHEVGPVVTVRYRQDGTPVNVILAGSPILVEGELVGMVAVYTDITERVQAENEIQRRNRELALLNRVITATTSTLDLEQILQIACRQLAHVFDLPQVAAALLDDDRTEITVIAEHMPPQYPGALGISIPLQANTGAKSILKHKTPLIIDDTQTDPRLEPVRSLLQERQIVALLALPLVTRGQVTGLIGMGSDRPRAFHEQEVSLAQNVAAAISQALETARLYQALQHRTDALARALAQQKELERLKNQFIQNVSHELRTPLAIARGYAELLEDGTLGVLQPEQCEPVAIIARRMRMLTHLMDDVNAILEAEIREFEREFIDLSELVHATLADFQMVAQERKIDLSAQVAPASFTVLGEPTQVRRVLDNLIGNALKFTPAGGRITVRLQRQNCMALLEVADTGVGIPPDKLERVFERFYQVDGSMSRRYGGTGLGLALVKEIVEAHGGQVRAESELERGSNFFVRLPLLDESLHEPDV